ncbi:hypothetical protein LG634_02940 [Streptomyces bambusae]|uniref:hypothetical protein n=1 Tax=Streptomyces bambusae TaxID=1550616 RepID=UPI001CFE6E19|nr:hypothetical protein [Streptomyces bambusae]MCB5163800.1 hypothetical protein [Streptomyces bambusae]
MTTQGNDTPSGRRIGRRTPATWAALTALCWPTTGCGLFDSANATMGVAWDTPCRARPPGTTRGRARPART